MHDYYHCSLYNDMAGHVYVPMGQRHQGFHKPTVSVGYLTPKRCLVMLAGILVFSTVILQILFSFRFVSLATLLAFIGHVKEYRQPG